MAISKINSKALVDCSVADVDIEDGSITNAKLAGSIANAKLANSSITVNGNTVSLGASGNIPPVSWQSVVTADGSTTTTAVSGNGYFIDTTSAAHTITLPASPSAGDYVAIKDYAGTFGTNALTIGRNSENIQGVANDSEISTNRASVVLVYIDSTKGWLYTVESNVADLQSPLFTQATGGTIVTSGDYKVHTFTGDGCFVVSQIGNSPAVPTGGPAVVDYLVVAGGGGDAGFGAGGGGAGGFRMSNSTCMPAPTTSPLASPTGITVTATTYPVTVGAGGSGSAGGSDGSNSVFSTITSAGGGKSVAGFGAGTPGIGNSGGSGGGGSSASGASPSTPGGAGNTPPVSPPQGNPGGNGSSPSGSYSSGGGGGAGAAGSNAPNPGPGGNGGVGSYVSPTFAVSCAGTPGPVGSTRYFAGGGGGTSNQPAGTGGAGGGGTSASNYVGGSAGTANTGGGSGGNVGGCCATGGGGKGIVIIRYKFQ